MAANFPFIPMGLTAPITVGASLSTATVWISKYGGATGTVTVAAGNYAPAGFRVANVGTVPAWITFSTPGQPNTAAVGTSMPVFPNTVETFCIRGQNSVAHISEGTVTLFITPGEGL